MADVLQFNLIQKCFQKLTPGKENTLHQDTKRHTPKWKASPFPWPCHNESNRMEKTGNKIMIINKMLDLALQFVWNNLVKLKHSPWRPAFLASIRGHTHVPKLSPPPPYPTNLAIWNYHCFQIWYSFKWMNWQVSSCWPDGTSPIFSPCFNIK